MKKTLLLLVLSVMAYSLSAQKVDSIYFHLYTDSLKKGTHNYINVDGKLSDGKWRPLTEKEIQFSADACEFSGNELVVPAGFQSKKITVKAVLKSNPAIWKEVTIWVKTLPDPPLPTKDEMFIEQRKNKKNRN